MIIVEGCDGSGKSTLIERISRRFGLGLAVRASDSIKGPVENLPGWVDEDLKSWGSKDVQIYDRYPLFSEPIYGPICRGRVDERFTSAWLSSRLRTVCNMALVIWCVPSLDDVKQNVTGADQMDGVIDNIEQLWLSYALKSREHLGNSVVWNYKDPNEVLVSYKIQTHLQRWRFF